MRSLALALMSVSLCFMAGPAWGGSDLGLPEKANVHLFLLMGGSNMVGNVRLTRVPPHPRILTFDSKGLWVEAVHPLHETVPPEGVAAVTLRLLPTTGAVRGSPSEQPINPLRGACFADDFYFAPFAKALEAGRVLEAGSRPVRGTRSPRGDTNLVANPGLESQEQFDWHGSAATTKRVQTNPHSGAGCLHVKDTSDSHGQGNSRRFLAPPGEYYVEAWVRVDPDLPGHVTFDVQYYDAEGTYRGSQRVGQTSSTEWTRLSGKVIVPGKVGPGISFARGVHRVVDDNVTIGLIPCAVEGSSLKRWQKGGDLYENALSRARAAMKAGTLTGVLWHQGEEDAKGLNTAGTYAERLWGMIADLRRDVGNEKLAFVVGRLSAGKRADRPGAELVNQALKNLPEKVPFTACADSADGGLYAEKMANVLGYTGARLPPGYSWSGYHFTYYPPEHVPGLPNVLLIGDSISMWYTSPVRKRLEGKANVYRPAANCRTTEQTLRYLDTYLGDRDWDVIHFNWGIHDITHVDDVGRAVAHPEGRPWVPIESYEKNLHLLMKRLKATGAELIWCSTTPVIDEKSPWRRTKDIQAYNAVARMLMAEYGIPINDLYSLASRLRNDPDRYYGDAVHFSDLGSERLAEQVAASIEKALAQRAGRTSSGR